MKVDITRICRLEAPARSADGQLKSLARHRRRFQRTRDRAEARFAQRIRRCEQSVLDALFARHPDLEAVAFTVRISPYNDEGPESGLDGLLVAGEVTTQHPAFAAAEAMFVQVELASYVCWPSHEDRGDTVTIARRSGPTSCLLSVEDAWEHDGEERLEQLVTEYPPHEGQNQQRTTF